ncbi:MAG: sulfatase, partial [Verrucomicrobia bacterium]|nr:sulfatase [Verrucomicrobiota bacterium]
PEKPNFIVIFCDDLGYGDLGCYGSPTIATPNLDRMASEGTKFTSFYVASPVCSPSRAALLTGCYPKRIGLENHVVFPHHRHGLNPSEITIATMLRKAGYATACVGKWHVGHVKPFLPTDHGFDSYFGIPYSNDMATEAPDGRKGAILMRNEKVIDPCVDQATLTPRYTGEALKFIRANKDRPFFLYFPHTFPHIPLFTAAPFAGTSKRGLYGDVVQTLDWSVGEILKELRALGLDERTLVLFTSDNGPWLPMKERGGSAGPLREGKGTTYEGGMREPCIVRWPGRVPAGRTSSEMWASIDVLPTIARLAGVEAPADRVLDGRDAADLVLGRPDAPPPRSEFFFYSDVGRLDAVRSGPWKLRTVGQGRELFNVETDVSERFNVATNHADIVARLAARMAEFDADLSAHIRPCGKLPDAPPVGPPGRAKAGTQAP